MLSRATSGPRSTYITTVHPGRCRELGPERGRSRGEKEQKVNHYKTITTATITISTENQLLQDQQEQLKQHFNHFKTNFIQQFNTMAQISSNWTAPTFSFDEADKPHAWEIFYLTSQDYLEVLRIKPAEEDKEKRGWEQLTKMFKGENRQILQNLVDNNTITETHQWTPILALKAIETAIKNKEHHRTSTTTTRTKSATTTTTKSTKCPWKQFYKRIIKYMDSLHEEPLEPQMKIDTFVSAIRNTFPIESSTKQTQTSEQPRQMAQTQTMEQLSSRHTQQRHRFSIQHRIR